MSFNKSGQIPAAMQNDLKQLGSRIRAFRQQIGLTAEDLACGCGSPLSQMMRIERGEFDLTIEDFCGG